MRNGTRMKNRYSYTLVGGLITLGALTGCAQPVHHVATVHATPIAHHTVSSACAQSVATVAQISEVRNSSSANQLKMLMTLPAELRKDATLPGVTPALQLNDRDLADAITNVDATAAQSAIQAILACQS